MSVKVITEDEFYEVYKPIKNHLDNNASFDGFLYETFGEEIEYCFKLSKLEKRVWTIIECNDEDEEIEEDDDGMPSCLYAVSGFHYVNRIGFMVTEKPYTKDTEVKLI